MPITQASETSVMRPIAVFALSAEPPPRNQASILQQQRQARQLLDAVGESACSDPPLVKHAACVPTYLQTSKYLTRYCHNSKPVSMPLAGSNPLTILSKHCTRKRNLVVTNHCCAYRTAMTSAAPPTTSACATPATGEWAFQSCDSATVTCTSHRMSCRASPASCIRLHTHLQVR
jgi:hypothetical protein